MYIWRFYIDVILYFGALQAFVLYLLFLNSAMIAFCIGVHGIVNLSLQY